MVGQERITSGPFFLVKEEQQFQRYDQSLPHFIISHHECSSSQDKRTVVEAAENKRWLLGTAPTPQFKSITYNFHVYNGFNYISKPRSTDAHGYPWYNP